MYRTGDLARLLPDGTLELLGRTDDQLKIRGHRVEPSEVEAVIEGHPSVQAAAVVARPDEGGDARLVAYVVSTRNDPVPSSELRTYLRGRLPEVMVPSAFVFLDQLPRTPNGKVDRRALPAAGPTVSGAETAYEPPRTPLEKRLATMWAELLGAPRVGVHDNFFDLGGQSLLATRLVARLRDGLGVELPLRDVFEAPTVAELAARIEPASTRLTPPDAGPDGLYEEGEI
jgi:acyl carrier protein